MFINKSTNRAWLISSKYIFEKNNSIIIKILIC